MKRHKQMRIGNVTGAGKKYRGQARPGHCIHSAQSAKAQGYASQPVPDMTTPLPTGTHIHLPDGGTGTITGANPLIERYEVLPDGAPPDEETGGLRHLVRFESARATE